MAISAAQQAAIDKLLATGKYETYTNAAGQTDIKLKSQYQTQTQPATTTNVTPVKTGTITPGVPAASTPATGTQPAVDPTIQKYKDDYAAAEKAGNKQGMLTAAKAADDYRASIGQARQNDALVTRLTSQVGTGAQLPKMDVTNTDQTTQKLLDYISQLTNTITGYQREPIESETDYMKNITDYITNLLKQQQATGEANTQKARTGILSDAEIARNQMNDVYQQQLAELTSQADKIRAAYDASKRGIEANKAETLPEFQSAKSQADIKTQQSMKNLQDIYAKRGLSAGGQVASELGQAAQTGLTEQGNIEKQQEGYLRETSNKLADIEGQQTTGLADIERMKGTAAQTLSSGQRDVITKVNAALSNLTVDEKTLLDNLAAQRTTMLYEANQTYKDMSQKDKDAAFNQMLQQAGVAADSVNTIRNLIDDINKSKIAAIDAQIKELELQNLPKAQKLELEKIREDMRLNKISATQASQRIALEKDKFAFDKQQQLSETERTQYNNYIEIIDSSSFVSRDADGKAQISDKEGLRNYIIKLFPDNKEGKYNNLIDSLLLRYGLRIN